MFGSTKEVKAEEQQKITYVIKVEEARTTKNDHIIMLDIEVNGVKIKNCMLKEAEVKKDGEVHKAGDIVYFLNFPSEKVGNKYYNRAWFPVSNENMQDIINQVQSLLK